MECSGNRRFQCLLCPCLGGAEPFFDLAPHLFNGIQIRRIRGQPANIGADATNQSLNFWHLVGRQIVHNHTVARLQGRSQNVSNIRQKHVGISRAIHYHALRLPVHSNGGYHCRTTPMTMRRSIIDPLAPGRSPPQPRHIGLGTRFIQEYEAVSVPSDTLLFPCPSGCYDIGTILFTRAESLFLYVIPISPST